MNYKAVILACFCFIIAIFLDGIVEQRRALMDEGSYLSILLYSTPNFISVFFISLPVMFTSWSFNKFVPGLVLGTIIYELMQVNLEWGTMDYLDIVFTIAAGLTALLLNHLLHIAGLLPSSKAAD